MIVAPPSIALRSGKQLTTMTGDEIESTYPGIGRFKPVTYYGTDFRQRTNMLGMASTQDIATLYQRVDDCFTHYWPGVEGHRHCHELRVEHSRWVKALQPYLLRTTQREEIHDSGVVIGFMMHPVELYRKILQLPKHGKGLTNGLKRDGLEVDFCRVKTVGLSRVEKQLLALSGREKDGYSWVSIYELLNRPDNVFEICETVKFRDGRNLRDQEIPTTAHIRGWEYLSISIAIAHEGRLSGELGMYTFGSNCKSLYVSGAERAITAAKCKSMLITLPESATVHFGVGRIIMQLDSSDVLTLTEAAYRNGLLPLFPMNEIEMNWQRLDSEHDLLFEILLSGNTLALMDLDSDALRKGKIHV